MAGERVVAPKCVYTGDLMMMPFKIPKKLTFGMVKASKSTYRLFAIEHFNHD